MSRPPFKTIDDVTQSLDLKFAEKERRESPELWLAAAFPKLKEWIDEKPIAQKCRMRAWMPEPDKLFILATEGIPPMEDRIAAFYAMRSKGKVYMSCTTVATRHEETQTTDEGVFLHMIHDAIAVQVKAMEVPD